MWKRDLCAGCTGFAAATTLYAMIHYLAEPHLLVAALLVISAAAFTAAIICYAVSVGNAHAAQAAASSRPRTVPASSQAA